MAHSGASLQTPRNTDRATPRPYEHKEPTPSLTRAELPVPNDNVMTPFMACETYANHSQNPQPSPVSPPPITTDIKPVPYGMEHATPRAQTRQEVDALSGYNIHRPSSTTSLQGWLLRMWRKTSLLTTYRNSRRTTRTRRLRSSPADQHGTGGKCFKDSSKRVLDIMQYFGIPQLYSPRKNIQLFWHWGCTRESVEMLLEVVSKALR